MTHEIDLLLYNNILRFVTLVAQIDSKCVKFNIQDI